MSRSVGNADVLQNLGDDNTNQPDSSYHPVISSVLTPQEARSIHATRMFAAFVIY